MTYEYNQNTKHNSSKVTQDHLSSKNIMTIEDLWSICPAKSINVGQAAVFLYEVPRDTSVFQKLVSERLKDHYITGSFLRKYGREKVASWLEKKIPLEKKSRSGELGEILATEFVNSCRLPFQVPIHRLVWKDGRELPMRGEDLVGFQFDSKPLGFLKGEAKSRTSLTPAVIAEARIALEKNDGLPLAHTLAYITERLYEINEDEKATIIEEYVRERLPTLSQVSHLIFTFSQNDPSAILQNDAKQACDPIKHYAVGLRASDHQGLIKEIYVGATNG